MRSAAPRSIVSRSRRRVQHPSLAGTLLAPALFSAFLACESEPAGPDADCPVVVPPRVTLATTAGEQVGTHGGYCIEHTGCGATSCTLGPAEPTQTTLVRPGDEVLFSVTNGELVAGRRCTPACPPILRVQKLDCQRWPVDHATLIDGKPWTVDLGAGNYWVELNSYFITRDGWSGQIGVGFGLVVSSNGARVVREGAPSDGGCDGGVKETE
jgi:hypothetical protein